jgi:hypothetical protein
VPEALEAIENIGDTQLRNPLVAPYYAALLLEAGRLDAAREIVGLARDKLLLPEERRLLRTVRDRLGERGS